MRKSGKWTRSLKYGSSCSRAHFAISRGSPLICQSFTALSPTAISRAGCAGVADGCASSSRSTPRLPFCRGENDRGWKATFEGNYKSHKRTSTSGRTGAPSADKYAHVRDGRPAAKIVLTVPCTPNASLRRKSYRASRHFGPINRANHGKGRRSVIR